MENTTVKDRSEWTSKSYIWMSLLVWFCANALSQAAFIGTWGAPYGKELLNAEMGQWYWAMIALELAFYAVGITILTSRAASMRAQTAENTVQQSV